MARGNEIDPGNAEELAYDFEQASRVVHAMDRLRQEALKTKIPEIVTMVDATFRLMMTSYYCIVRYEMEKLSPAEE